MAERRRRRRRDKKKVNIPAIFAVFALLVCIAGLSVYAVDRISESVNSNIYDKSDEKILKYIQRQTKKENYFPNIMVDGIDIGGMNRYDAEKKLHAEIKLPADDTALIIKDTENKYNKTFTLDDFGIYFDLESAISSAYNFGRTGNDADKVADIRSLENTPQDFRVMYYDEAKIRAAVDAIASGINVEPVDSTVTKTSSGFEVTPSVIGYSMDADALYQNVISAVDERQFGSEVSFTVNRTDPQYNEEDFKYIDNEIGSCYSRYTKGDDNRITNLKNGCSKIDSVVLYPDEVFSTNAHFNPCTYENGWRMAGTIVNGQIEDSIGGGMCQVSSALYQAVLEAELEVVERFNHSMKVGYADYAFDATLAGDYKDLKFKNNTGYPLYIESYVTGSNVVVRLYGYEVHDQGRKLEFKNKFIKSTEPGEPKITEDNTKPEGYEEYKVTALSGKTYELYKYVYENGSLVDTVKVNTSVYSPRRAEIIRGTKPPEPEPEPETEPETDISDDDASVPAEAVQEEVLEDSLIEG